MNTTLFYRISIWIRTKEIKRDLVVGEVIGKKREKNTSYMYNLLKPPIFSSELYNISVQYGKLKETFDDDEFFNKYEKGESMFVILVQKLNKKGETIHQALELPE